MKEISEKKKKFLESIGIDIRNLPPEFKKYSDSMEKILSEEEIDFLNSESLTGRYVKTFSLKDLVGTIHPDYTDKTWLEAFLVSKRGDSAVDQYFENPNYYAIELKQKDQSNLRHDSPIELYESDGKFFIKGGNNRLSLIMMKYLAEMSKAQTEEERTKIEEEYTFIAEVQPIPKDKDIMYMINMIRDNYGDNVTIQRTATDDIECYYTVQIGEKTIIVSSKEDLEQILIESYRINGVESLDELQDNIANLIQDRIGYGARADQSRAKILNSVFPDLEHFQECLVKLREYGIEEKLYEGISLQTLTFSKLYKRAVEIVDREENRVSEEQQREAEKRKSEQRKKDIIVGFKREHIEQQATSIPNSVEAIYYELKQEEIKFSNLAEKLGLSYSLTRIDDTNIFSSIEQIKTNMTRISEEIQRVDDLAQLDNVRGVLQELENLTQDGTIKIEYSAELRERFEKSFNTKVQDLIRNSKISRLECERSKLESEKISIIGKVFGKGRLRQAKLENIDLKMQLLMTETQTDEVSYSLEESLSDLYTYSQCELGKDLTLEMKEFLSIVKTDPQLIQMIDQQQLRQRFNEKVDNRQTQSQLILIDGKRKSSNRNQADILQLQNNELKRQIQKNRARTVTRQNGLSSIAINSNSPLNRFQNMVNEINLSTQIREENQQERTEQEV